MAHHRPSFPFRNVTNSRLMPFCLLTVKIGLPFRSVTGRSPSAGASKPPFRRTRAHWIQWWPATARCRCRLVAFPTRSLLPRQPHPKLAHGHSTQWCMIPQDRRGARHDRQLSRSRRSDFLMILAAVRNGMAVLLTGRPTVMSLARGGMHGSCSQVAHKSASWLTHGVSSAWTTAQQPEASR